MNNDQYQTERSIEAALRTLEQQGTVGEGAKDRSRNRMRTAFTAARQGIDDRDTPPGQAELIRAISDTPSLRPRARFDSVRFLLTAAVIVVVVGAIVVLAGRQSAPNLDTADRPQTEQLLTDVVGDLPARLEPGTYTTDVLGTRVTFEVSTTVWLISEQLGWIELARGLEEQSSRLTMLRPADHLEQLGTSTADWITMHEDVTFQRSRAVAGDQTADKWVVFVTDTAIADGGCTVGDSCVPMFSSPHDIGLRAGGANELLEIKQGPHPPIFAIAWLSPTEPQNEAGRVELVQLVTLGEPQPTPH